MTTFVTITPSGGEAQVVTLQSFIKRLDDPGQCFDAMLALVQRGSVDVRLIGGTDAVITYADPISSLPRQAVIPFTQVDNRGQPLREYDVAAQLLFELPAYIRCRARSEREATGLVGDVLRGEHAAPAGFIVEINGDDLEAFITGLEIASSNAAHGLGVREVTVTGINERLQLGGTPS